jgi:hypothetical protein
MNNIFDALEICLQELEKGADVETVLARFPDLAGELRPILKTSLKARSMSAAPPAEDVIRRGRARVLQHAAEVRESKAPPRRRVLPAFQRLALSFTLAALLLLSGTGLLNASASALPGESLYPVKRTWEGLRLLLIFNEEARELLEHQFESERLHEVTELLTEGRHETIQFAGVFMQVNGITYISGVQVIMTAGMQLPANGAAVIVTGRTNAQGFVEVTSLDLLPTGSIVPAGDPIEVELESEGESGVQSFAMEGTLQSISATTLVINGMTVYLDAAQINGELCIGVEVEVTGYFAEDGAYMVTEVEAKGSCSSGSGSENTNSNTNSNTNDSSDSNENSGDDNDNDKDNDNGDDHSNDNEDGGGDKDDNDNNDDGGNGGSGGNGNDNDDD